MFTDISTIEELKQVWIELFLDKTNKGTKVSNTGVLNAVAFGNAKLAQKILKEIAVTEAHIFPDSAFGTYLDNIAKLQGISARQGAMKSSMYIRVVGVPGTVYTAGTQIFQGNSGQTFDLTSSFTIPAQGFGYVKVRSTNAGQTSNVDSLTITKVNPVPTGHLYCINEYGAFGGADAETDEVFRNRIKEGCNILARGTIAYLEQVFNKINNDVFKVYYHGINDSAQVVLAILTQSGIDLTTDELNQLELFAQTYLNLTELKPDGFNGSGIELQNVNWFPIDISFRVKIFPYYDPDAVRKEIQIRLNKYFDYRFWNYNDIVVWTDLLQLVRTTPGVQFAFDNFFTPNNDFTIPVNQLPRVRGCLMLDNTGAIISNGSNTINPIYYPAVADFNFQSSVLSSIA